MSKKKLLSLALVVIMIAILSFSTLAWFSDSDDVTNNFYIASSDDTDPDDIFSVDVWENTPDGDKDQNGYEYKDVLPGDVLKKEVSVENTGYYDQYIRVTITVSDATAWMEVLKTNGAAPKLEQLVDGYDPNANIWVDTSSEVDAANDTLVYTLHYRNILLGDQDSIYDNGGVHSDVVQVFTAVKIPASMTVEQAAKFESNFQITVKAEAVQTENLGLDRSNGDGAKEAFAVVEGA